MTDVIHFGILTDPDDLERQDVEISRLDEQGRLDEEYDVDIHNTMPSWWPKSSAWECGWHIPKEISTAQCKTDLEALGFIYHPEWVL